MEARFGLSPCQATLLVLISFALVACGGGGGGGTQTQPINCSENVRLTFQSIDNAPLNTEYISNIATADGLCSARDIFFFSPGRGTAAYSIDGGPWITQRSTIQPGQAVRIRMTSAPTYGTRRVAGLTIGEEKCGYDIFGNWVCRINGESGSFAVTTLAGSPTDAPDVYVTFPADGEVVNAVSLNVIGSASDPDGVEELFVNGVRARTTDGFASWEAEIPLTTGHNDIVVDVADTLLNRRTDNVILSFTNTRLTFEDAREIDMTSQSSILYVVAPRDGGLFSVNTLTDDWTLLSDEEDSPLPFMEPRSIFVDEGGNRAWVVDYGYDEVMEISLADGNRTLLTGSGEPLANAKDVVLDESRNQLFVLEQLRGPTTSQTFESARVMAVDLATGNRQLLSDNATPPGEPDFWFARSLEFDAAGDRLLAIDMTGVLTIDPVTGERSLLWESDYNDPVASDLNPIGASLILPAEYRILQVDLTTGESSVLSEAAYIGNPEYDYFENKIYWGNRSIYVIDLNTDERYRVY